jgi:hypothetical protein
MENKKSKDFKTQTICTLHREHPCSYRRSYEQSCDLKLVDEYATASCSYRIIATVLPLVEKECDTVLQETHIESSKESNIDEPFL